MKNRKTAVIQLRAKARFRGIGEFPNKQQTGVAISRCTACEYAFGGHRCPACEYAFGGHRCPACEEYAIHVEKSAFHVMCIIFRLHNPIDQVVY